MVPVETARSLKKCETYIPYYYVKVFFCGIIFCINFTFITDTSLALFCPNVTDEPLPESVLCRCFQQSSNLGYMNVFTSVSIIPINLSYHLLPLRADGMDI